MRRPKLWLLTILALGLTASGCKAPTAIVPAQCSTQTPAGAAAVGPAGDDAKIRVATFNLLHGLDPDPGHTMLARLELAADAVVDAGVDVLGTQETSVTPAAAGPQVPVAQRLAAELAERTGETWWWCWYRANPHLPGATDAAGGRSEVSDLMSRLVKPGEQFWDGVAVVSRHPIEESAARRLDPRGTEVFACREPDKTECTQTALFESRVLLWADVATPAGQLDFFSTHLAHTISSDSETTRARQVATVVETVDDLASPGPLPDVLVGDFNTLEGSPVYATPAGAGFVDTFRSANPAAPGFTSDQDLRAPASTVSSRIDYVWARPGSCGIDIAAGEVFGDTPAPFEGGSLWPSDHHAVWSDITCGV